MGFIKPAASTGQRLHFHIFYKKKIKIIYSWLEILNTESIKMFIAV